MYLPAAFQTLFIHVFGSYYNFRCHRDTQNHKNPVGRTDTLRSEVDQLVITSYIDTEMSRIQMMRIKLIISCRP